MDVKKEKIIVAMSGGVDSSVCAAFLKRRGFEVQGIYMRLFDERDKDNERAAKAVADKLGIRFSILDLRKEFQKQVIDYFLQEFALGRTPNPCIVCNQEIKFGLLLNKVLAMNGNFIATGHYARIAKDKWNSAIRQRQNKARLPLKGGVESYRLLVAKDQSKDQSYFLYNLTQEKLAKILFPVGDYKKSEIYKMAEKWQLPHKRGESVDICFVGKSGHYDFLKKHLGVHPGKIIDTSGKNLGNHQGLWFYTIGQRADVGGPGPFYVIKLDPKNNVVVVSNKFCEPLLYGKNLVAGKVNWIAGSEPKMPLICRAKIRYGHVTVECIVENYRDGKYTDPFCVNLHRTGLCMFDKKYFVEFRRAQRAITPGQSVVFYKRNEVLGGGIIELN